MSSRIASFFRNLLHKRTVEQALDDELQSAVELLIQEKMKEGLSHSEARRQALIELGGIEQVKEEVRAIRLGMLLDTFAQDVRFALRMLRKSPWFTTVAVLTLALGIGGNAAIFQLLDAMLLRTLPVRDPASLAMVHLNTNHWGRIGSTAGAGGELSFPLWQQIAERQESFSSLAAWGGSMLNLANGGEVDYANTIWVSGEYFEALEIRPFLGRLISPSDDPENAQAGCPSGVDLSYSFWQRRYGGDRSVIGKTLTLEGHPFSIIGVTPPSFYGVSVGWRFDVAVPVCAEPIIAGQYSAITGPNAREDWWLAILGRLKPGWTLARATAQLESIAPVALQATVPPQYDSDEVKHYLACKPEARSAANGFFGGEGWSDPLYLLLGLSGLVLLIACATLANLLLARASAREREIAVRLALGAWRGRLIRQLLSESALLAIVGAGLAVWLASALSHAFISSVSAPLKGFGYSLDMPTDWRVLGFAAGLAVITTLLFGLAPALRASGAAPESALKKSGRGMTAGRRRFRLQRIVVASQVALSVVLLASALIFARSLRSLITRNPGFQQNGVLVANLDTTRLKLSVDQAHVFERHLLDRVLALPDVVAAGTSIRSPGSDRAGKDWVLDAKGKRSNVKADLDWISPDYFHTMEIPILAGRDFNYSDTAMSSNVAIVNQAFVKTFLKGAKDPIGEEFRMWQSLGKPEPYYTVVGLVRDSVYDSRDYMMRAPMPPIVYFARTQISASDPQSGLFTGPVLLIRTSGGMTGPANSVKDAIAGVNREIKFQFAVLRTQIRGTLAGFAGIATLCGFFGGLALLLAAMGLYGVISYTIAQRTNEIGIRMALGAQRSGVVRLIMSEAAIMVGVGLVVGLGLTLAAGLAVSSWVFGPTPRDPLTLALTVLILAAVGFAASFLSARRATRLDPMVALRCE